MSRPGPLAARLPSPAAGGTMKTSSRACSRRVPRLWAISQNGCAVPVASSASSQRSTLSFMAETQVSSASEGRPSPLLSRPISRSTSPPVGERRSASTRQRPAGPAGISSTVKSVPPALASQGLCGVLSTGAFSVLMTGATRGVAAKRSEGSARRPVPASSRKPALASASMLTSVSGRRVMRTLASEQVPPVGQLR